MKRWAKEDRYSWENSEVMREFESKILSNYSFLEKSAQQKLSPQSLQTMRKEVIDTTNAVKELNKTLSTPVSAADDGSLKSNAEECQHDAAEDCAICRGKEDDYSDDEVIMAKASILIDLKKMANDAIRSGNIKLAYKIERTISEVEEE
jgi:hypothetical protein